MNKNYSEESNQWFHDLKDKNISQNRVQTNNSTRNIFQHHNKFKSYQNKNVSPKIVNWSQNEHWKQTKELKCHFQNHFKQGPTINIPHPSISRKPTLIFCNYCCKVGHISLECRFRKRNNMSNVIWVPKSILD